MAYSDISAIQQGARDIARRTTAQNAGGISRSYGTVEAVNDSTLDVNVNGTTLAGLRMTTACAGAEVGDRCIIDTAAHRSIVIGILA